MSNIQEELRAILNNLSDHMGMSTITTDEAIVSLTSLITREKVKELRPYTDLQDEPDGTHFTPCKICGQRSHHCQCDQALMFVERKAEARIKILTPGGSDNETN